MRDETVQLLVNAILTVDPLSSESFDSTEFFGKKKWEDLSQRDDPLMVQSLISEAANLITKVSGKHISIDRQNISDTGTLLKRELEIISLEATKCYLGQKNEECITPEDWDKVDLFIARTRNIILGGLVREFNKIEDDINDRTLLLNNARQLDLQIECANNNLCASEASKYRLSGPFVELFKSGDISQ